MWRMYCVCLLSVIVVLDLLGQSHVNRTLGGAPGWVYCYVRKANKQSSNLLVLQHASDIDPKCIMHALASGSGINQRSVGVAPIKHSISTQGLLLQRTGWRTTDQLTALGIAKHNREGRERKPHLTQYCGSRVRGRPRRQSMKNGECGAVVR